MDTAEVLTALGAKIMAHADGVIPTGSLGLDLALGGGYRMGKIAEIAGDYSTQKSQLALHTVAQAQKLGQVLWLDSASDFNPEHARQAGVDPDKLVIHRPDDVGRAMYTMRVAADDFSMMVLDSASGLDFTEDCSTLDAWFAWLKSDLQPNTVALFINNLRLRSDDWFGQTVRAWSSQHVRLYPFGSSEVQAIVAKTSWAPHLPCTIRLKFSGGSMIPEYELVRMGVETGVLARGGSWIKYDGYILGEGVRRSVDYLTREPKLALVIREAIKARLA